MQDQMKIWLVFVFKVWDIFENVYILREMSQRDGQKIKVREGIIDGTQVPGEGVQNTE